MRRDEGEEDVYQSSEQYQEGDEEVENKGAKELEGDCDRSEEEEAECQEIWSPFSRPWPREMKSGRQSRSGEKKRE